MQNAIAASTPSLPSLTHARGVVWTGRILSAIAGAFLAFDAIVKIAAPAAVAEASAKVGVAAGDLRPIGLTLLVATLLFAIPRTAVLGAVAITAYLGGATATMVLAGQPFYFPVVFGVVVWAALVMRRPQLRTLFI